MILHLAACPISGGQYTRQRFVPVNGGLFPSWAKQNDWIITSPWAAQGANIVDGNSGNLLWSLNTPLLVADAEWSPTDDKIVFPLSGDIHTMRVTDGSALTNITNHPANDISPDWRPIVPPIEVRLTPLNSSPVAYKDIPTSLTITNNTSTTITNWTLELAKIAVPSLQPGENYNTFIPLAVVNGDGGAHNGRIGGVLNQNPRLLYGQGSNFAPALPANGGFVSRQPILRPLTSGAIWVSYKFTDLDTNAVYEGMTTVMQAQVTDIVFTDEVKSLIFWMIFHETSEDTDETPYIPFEGQPTPTGPLPSTEFLRNSPYCVPLSVAPGKNQAPAEQTGPGSGWNENIAYIYHCNPSYRDPSGGNYTSPDGDHRYNDTQAIINGFLNRARNTGAASIVGYATSNFSGSLGKGDITLWLDPTDNCPDQPLGRYQAALESRNNQRILEWLHKYRVCLVNHPSSGLVAIERDKVYSRAWQRIGSQIDLYLCTF